MCQAIAPSELDGFELRLLTQNDQEIVWEMLMYAAHETTDVRSMPILVPYGQDFGQREGDVGVIAVDKNGVAVGAAWARLLGKEQGLGHVADDVPELAIAVLPSHQGRGIGSSLLRALLERLQKSGVRGVSLGCRSDNPAFNLYKRFGLVVVPGSEVVNRTGGTSFTMVVKFR